MHPHVDGIIFSLQRHGGISVYFRELVAHMRRRQQPLTLTLETPLAQDDGDLPGRPGRIEARAGRWLERIRPCRPVASATVFHSSYYRVPAASAIPSVVTVHDFIHERFRKGWSRRAHMMQKRAAIRSAQAVICISNSTRDDMLHWVGETPGQQVFVIHNGVADAFRPLSLAQAGRPFVLFVGERAGYKNFGLLLRAMQQLPDIEVHCVGGGPLRADEFEHAPPSARERVKHLGYVSDEELNEHYNRALCLAYPSSYEGFGIPVVEAMRAGCPVVSIDCKAVREIGGDALVVAQEGDPLALASAIERTASSACRAGIIETGLRVAARYSWERTHDATLDVYRSVGGGRHVRLDATLGGERIAA